MHRVLTAHNRRPAGIGPFDSTATSNSASELADHRAEKR